MAEIKPRAFELEPNMVSLEVPWFYNIRELNDPFPNSEGKGEQFFRAKRELQIFQEGSEIFLIVEMRFRWNKDKSLDLLNVSISTAPKIPESKRKSINTEKLIALHEEANLPYLSLERFEDIRKLVQESKLVIEYARKVGSLLAVTPAEGISGKLSEKRILEIELAENGHLKIPFEPNSMEFARISLEIVEWLEMNGFKSRGANYKAYELITGYPAPRKGKDSQSLGKPSWRQFERYLNKAREERRRATEEEIQRHNKKKATGIQRAKRR